MKYACLLFFTAFTLDAYSQGLDIRMFDGDNYAIKTERTTNSGPPWYFSNTSGMNIGTTSIQTTGSGILGNYFPYLVLNPDGGNITINGTTASTQLHLHQKDYTRYLGEDGSGDVIPIDGGITLETTITELFEEGGSDVYTYKWRVFVSKYGSLCFSLNGTTKECISAFNFANTSTTSEPLHNQVQLSQEQEESTENTIEQLLKTIQNLESRLADLETRSK